jgi:D-serine dehydratase
MSQEQRREARREAFETLARTLVEPGTKGIPPQVGPVPLGEIGRRGWNLLAGDLTMPAAVLRRSALGRNSAVMRAFLAGHAMAIAPHGKTTMAPQLFALQAEDGAWGMTISTVQHLAICRRFAFDRVIIANELVGRAEIDAVFAALAESPELELYCLIDSVAGVARLAEGGRRSGALARINCLVEVGAMGGRAGCRSLEAALAVAEAAAAAGLPLRGVEGFEGILADAAAVDAFLDFLCDTAEAIAAAGLFVAGRPVVLSAGGSTYYDRVAQRLARGRGIGGAVEIIARSGCYLTHDSGVYADAVRALSAREPGIAADAFTPALLVFTHVQSRPEAEKAILAMGRRDAGTDAGLPVPLLVCRPGADAMPRAIPPGHKLTGMNDQHAHLACPPGSDIAVGDIVAFGVSHPCTTFDKWQVLFVVDDDWTVVDAIRTFF